jgi:hypothetical protein
MTMSDLIYLALIFGGFAVCGLAVFVSERL